MRHRAAVALGCLLALGAARDGTADSAGTPATWITRELEINLQGLPKAYSCDDLWYKLHGILLAIGAREYMAITPYDCGHAAAGGGRSPTLDLKFQTLRALSGANVRWAQTTAVSRIVRLAPGEPKILDAGDCALLEQLEGTLFAYLGLHAVSSHLDCSAPRRAARFDVSLEALVETSTPASET